MSEKKTKKRKQRTPFELAVGYCEDAGFEVGGLEDFAGELTANDLAKRLKTCRQFLDKAEQELKKIPEEQQSKPCCARCFILADKLSENERCPPCDDIFTGKVPVSPSPKKTKPKTSQKTETKSSESSKKCDCGNCFICYMER